MSSTGGSLRDGSLLMRDQQRSFDVSEEHEVLAFLKAIHQSPLETAQKNALRDLVFAYKQNDDPAELAQLIKAAENFGFTINAKTVVPLEVEQSATLQAKVGLGATRPAPRFEQAQQLKTDPAGSSVQQEMIKTKATAPVEAVKKEAGLAQEVREPFQAPVPEAVKHEETIPAQAAAPDPASRIQEIKRVVNEKVGNPVNLINAHQTVGREYMNALLDAMKKSNGGTSEEISSAMARLERAFKAVENIDMANSRKPEQPQPEAVQNAIQTPSSAVQAEKKEPVSEPSLQMSQIEPAKPAPAEITPEPTTAAPAEEVQNVARMSSVRSQLQSELPANQARVVQTAPEMPSDAMHSVAKEKQLQDLLRLDRLKNAQAKKAQIETQIGSMDPLVTPEVTSGLDQLLSEWALFKSSGIFGTGPSGKEHPLYKKISTLTMAAVIAGRFDGATPQVKQSITDYMNGWRYEEGVVHEHGETFEHYLRRVVRHILNKRQNR